jgi:hypothetical protein
MVTAASFAETNPPPLRRFGLVMGANSGGDGSVRLRYAASDARAFASLLTELGGVRDSDLVLLLDPTLSAFRGAAERVRAAAASASSWGQRCEFVLYYSGHSDEEGLLLGKEKLNYSDLRSAIERVPAAVRVAILDSCSSGSMTRVKGGSPRPAFLFDASSDMEGHAYITSSSEAEAAQESDRIGGSFFTHYLVSALRGAADVRGEGRVTINEAYAYAFRETLASTENTQYGPQHPAYEINLTGSGDLVLTDLRSSKAGLVLTEALSGALYVRDAKGKLAVELDKSEGDRMEIGLPPGKYSVSMIKGDSRYMADVLVADGGRTSLAESDFRPVAAEAASARGVAVVPSRSNMRRDLNIAGYPISLDMSLLPDLSGGIFSSETDDVVSLNLLWGTSRDVKGAQLSTFLNSDSGDVRGFQFSTLANIVRGDAVGLQLASLADISFGSMRGVQLSSIADVASGGFNGLQVSSLVNVAGGEGKGGQLGLVNVASDVVGAQVGLLNVASYMRGTQVGLVNVAKRIDGFPVGLVNLEEGGVRSPQVWTEGTTGLFLGFAFGTRIVYTLISGGADREDDGSFQPSAGAGIGGRITVGRFFGDMDLSWREFFGLPEPTGPSSRLELRALAGFPTSAAGLILGCAIEGYMPGLSREDDGSAVSSFHVEPRFLFGVKL